MALNDFTDSLPMLLYRASDAVMPRFRRIFNESGITEQQWRVLRVLAEVNSMATRELAGVCLIPAPSLVGIVDRLQHAELVARAPVPGDRRKVMVSITPQGMHLHDRVGPQVTATYAELMQSIGPRQWIALSAALNDLLDTLED